MQSEVSRRTEQKRERENPRELAPPMASSKVMASTNSNQISDLTHQLSFPTTPGLHPDQVTTEIATSMDDFLKNIYGESPSHNHPHISASPFVHSTAAEGGAGDLPEMTLEDFLTRAGGAVRDEEMRIPPIPAQPPPQCFASAADITSSVIGGGTFGVVAVGNGQFQSSPTAEGFGNGGGMGGGKLRAKRRAAEEPMVDKATQQRQKRMIKNRESAARSRERKQAYTIELESLAAQLEEENARLQNEEAQETRKRFKLLMQNVIPVTEKRRPPRTLSRVNSMVW